MGGRSLVSVKALECGTERIHSPRTTKKVYSTKTSLDPIDVKAVFSTLLIRTVI